ncbi:DUF4190 domain-containing protein [Streptomyces sp. LP05-1]|uniref:DUF4190 domain-containing protein n=1 Tax=Streptomyces pyxinae TaxID=2970734 RepID=A0ABT2CBJ0_9ACTN|nr:DUF4190 domain-containing protein [Streptomyces sp. LP05-1]MCS0634472.1 DUF4190 domain-containing protein [Streptomyces sp. LP05-1]
MQQSSPQGWPPPEQSQPGQSPYGPSQAGQSPYGHLPPPPYGMPVPPPPAAQVNGLAITSLITGIVCCVPLVGVILGAVALRQIKRRGERGKGLAVSGIVLSLVGTLILVAGLATGGFRTAYDGFREAADKASRSRSTLDLRTGQCYDDPSEEAVTTEVRVVDCDRPHDGEVTGLFQVSGFSAWPGDEVLEPLAEKRCQTVAARYAMDTWAVPDNAWLFYYQPSKESWRLGDRAVTCAYAAESGKLTGSVRADATTLNSHQSAFLTAVNPIESAVGEEPEADAEDDLAANRKWAGELSATLGATAAQLRARSWPAASAGAVASLVKEIDAAGGHWREAAAAGDAGVFYEAYDSGYEALPPDLGKRARVSLGLDGTPARSADRESA